MKLNTLQQKATYLSSKPKPNINASLIESTFFCILLVKIPESCIVLRLENLINIYRS